MVEECERRRRRDSDLTASSMDPPSEIHETPPFSSERAPVYNLSEIWPFPLRSTGNVRSPDGNLDLKTSLFPFENPSNPTDRNPDDDGADDLMTADHAGSQDCATGKRRDGSQNDNSSTKLDGKRAKTTAGSREEGSDKAVEQKLQNPVPTGTAKQDFIHVRARRGQATDSHSLAERARREKISERMKILQDLVPGCNKVVGKALVLDEIINYIQSLQRQIEFLSMKLEAVTSRMNLSIDGLQHSKNFEHQAFDDAAFGSQDARDYGRSSSPGWLHMQIGGGFERSS